MEQFQRNLAVVSGTTAHHSLFKLLPCDDLDLFLGKVKFSNLGFYIEKNVTVMDSKEIIAAFDLGIC